MPSDPFAFERASLLADVASAQGQARRSLDKARALQEQITMERGVWARERSQLLRKISENDDELSNVKANSSRRNSVTQQDIKATNTTTSTTTNSTNIQLPTTPQMMLSSSSSLELEAAVIRYKAAESECHRLRCRIEVLEKRLREKISTAPPEKPTSLFAAATPGNKKTNSGFTTTTSSSTIKRSSVYSTPKSSTTSNTDMNSSSIETSATSELLSRVIDAERAKQEAISLLTEVTNEAKKQAQEVKRLQERLEKFESSSSFATLAADSSNTNDDASTKTPMKSQPPPPPPSTQIQARLSTIATPYTPRQVAAHIPQSFSSRMNVVTTPRSDKATKRSSSLPIFGFTTPKSTIKTTEISAQTIINKSPAAAKIPPSCARAKALEYAASRVPNPILATTKSNRKEMSPSVGVFSAAIAALKTSSSNMKDRSNVHQEMTKMEYMEQSRSADLRRSNVSRTLASMPPPLPKHELQRLEREAAMSSSTIRVTSFEMKPRTTISNQPSTSTEEASNVAVNNPTESAGFNQGFAAAAPAWLARLPPAGSNISAGATIAAITRSDGGNINSTERHFEAF
jgi:hypothetical protein